MIATIIISGSLVLAGVYLLAWWLWPGLRHEIEAPGREFAINAKRYDRACGQPARTGREEAHGED